MSNRTSNIVVAICIISIIFSGLNTYLVLNESRLQQERLDQFQNTLDEVKNRILSVESTLSTLEDKLNVLNQSSILDISDLRAVVRRLDSNVSKLASDISSIKGDVENILSQTPANVYESVYKSIVTIRTPLGLGSGFVYNRTNLILTNWHVVKSETDIEVEFYDGTRKKAVTIGTDAYADVAIITVTRAPPDVKPLELGSSSNLYVGQQVVAVGNPLGLTASLSSGYISQINKLIDIIDVPIVIPVLQLDITIAPGSSGGPLLDISGNVIGITNAGTSYGFNFAVPSNIVKRVASSLIERGYYKHPFVGFYVIELNPEVIRELNILNLEPFQTGLLVWDVMENYPAAEAGLEGVVETRAPDGSTAYLAKDIVLAVDGHPTRTLADWSIYIEEYISPGQTITLTLWRSGKIVFIEVTTTFRPFYKE
jgi:S1-C subfamily serine protease